MNNNTFFRGNLLNDLQETLTSTIATTHQITQVAHVARRDTEAIEQSTNNFYYKFRQQELVKLFRDDSTTVNDFICNNYEIIARHIVKTLCYTFYTTKTGKQYYPNYVSLISIVKSGYTDLFFDDIKQEIALYLLTNSDKITTDENGKYTLENLYIDLFKMVRNFLYNNKLKLDAVEVAIIGYNNDNEECESIAVNSASYNTWLMVNNQDIINDITNDFNRIYFDVLQYVRLTEKPKIYNSCCAVLDLLTRGFKKKEICQLLNISKPSCIKYHNVIKDAFNALYKRNNGYTKDTSDTSDTTTKHNYFSVDFSNCHLYENTTATLDSYHFVSIDTYNKIDNMINIVNSYYHNKTQEYYDYIFAVEITENTDNTVNAVNSYYHDKKQKYYDNIFNTIKYGYDINIK